jgi:Mg2+ and Co2+ transporter CorA
MQTSIAYNQKEVRNSGTKEDINNGYNLWLDLTNPTLSEINEIQQSYNLVKNALQVFWSKSKKPQVRMLYAHTFTLILDIILFWGREGRNEEDYIKSGIGAILYLLIYPSFA